MKLKEVKLLDEEEFYSWVFTTQLMKHIGKELTRDQQQEGAVGNTCYILQVLSRNPEAKEDATQL